MASSTPIPFKFTTVDDPNSETNAVTGINQLSKIVGIYGGGEGSSIPETYTSQPPYTKFRSENDPGAQGTVATSLSSNKIVAGYVIDPNNLGGTWGFVRIQGLWTLLEDPNEGTGNNAITEILGINDSEQAVGFYTNSTGVSVAFELAVPTETYTDLTPPEAQNSYATGIDGKGNIVGWETTSGSVSASSFFLQTGTYYPLSYPGSTQTKALSLNWQDEVVGNYVDRSGDTHGFMLIGPTKGSGAQFWQKIDDPNAEGGTWVTGINNHDDICGYYVDGKGVQHGFVATP
ncbi:MAG: hypothetical protein JOZ77_05340 [Candidatus Eremiobacteraeota bacterium]|nr:hypothetical protein [Candidatus Eremiobacteraeota bacterium]